MAARGWPHWAAVGVVVWSAAYGAAGAWWTLGGAGYPFAPIHEDRRSGSILEGAPVAVVGPVMVALGVAGVIAGLLMTRESSRFRPLVIGFGWLAAVVMVVVVPDFTLLAVLAMWPALLVFAFTGVPGAQDGIGDILYWHRDHLILVFLAGVLIAVATIGYQRRTRGACPTCGRDDHPAPSWQSPARALTWGRRAVWLAVLSTVPYEVTRIAWYLGWPLGITDEFHAMMANTPGMLEMGLTLALLSLGGAVLTHGLVSAWGERYPRWLWFRAGRRVPPALAIIPATLVAVVLPPAGLMNFRTDLDMSSWAVNGPGMLWFGWAVGLAAATYAYYLRRRGQCTRCGRGASASEPTAASRVVGE